VRYGRSSSPKLLSIESPHALFCLVFYFNYMPILYCFQEVTIYSSKICVFRPFLPTLARGVPWDLGYKIWSKKTSPWATWNPYDPTDISSNSVPACHRWTHMPAMSHVSIAKYDRNVQNNTQQRYARRKMKTFG